MAHPFFEFSGVIALEVFFVDACQLTGGQQR
jgi:hypothetical protein